MFCSQIHIHEWEVPPFPGIVTHEVALPVFLSDGQVAGTVGIRTAIEVTEIAFGQELVVAAVLFPEGFSDKDILFVERISFAQCLGQCTEQTGKFVVGIDVGGVFPDFINASP